MDDTSTTELTIMTPGKQPVKTTLGVLGELTDRLTRLRNDDDGDSDVEGSDTQGEGLGYSGEDALNLARVARMNAGYSFSASHTGNAKLTTDNDGRRVLTVAFRITSRREDFPQVAGRIMELLGDVSKDDEVQVTVTPVIQQLPLM